MNFKIASWRTLAACLALNCGVAASQPAPVATASNPEVSAGDFAALTKQPAGVKLALENFYAKLSRNAKGIEIADDDKTQHAYVAWKLGKSAPGKKYTVTVSVAKTAAPGPVAAVAIRFFAGGKATDTECNFDPSTGFSFPRGAADAKSVNVQDGGAEWRVLCSANSPAAASEARIHIVPSIGPSFGNYDPAATGAVTVTAVEISVK